MDYVRVSKYFETRIFKVRFGEPQVSITQFSQMCKIFL
ncbi:hypothetical protein TcasGA2_TC033917 [Tribolium castaneum]|uniref:Uncharacterized protein n=1 Tax=Tribolium castaneum TaxID=7070 RepID=A0A139WDT0_TRICA|nr:hypothetical protein TcasGA2_TC033917 [Tribolium castaneum]